LDAALEARRRESLFNIIDRETGWKIDLIFRKSRSFSKEEFDPRRVVNLEGFPLYIASAEDVIIAKLEWSQLGHSQRQIEDVATIVRIRRDARDESYLEKWASALGLADEWSRAKRSARLNEDHPRAT